jgi:hypothetical protein
MPGRRLSSADRASRGVKMNAICQRLDYSTSLRCRLSTAIQSSNLNHGGRCRRLFAFTQSKFQ